MKTNVGKRIQEIAEIKEEIIRRTAMISGVIFIAAGLIAMIACAATDEELIGIGMLCLVVGIVVGWVIIKSGERMAEMKTIGLYGFGILVDKAEQLKPELLNQTGEETKAESAKKSVNKNEGSTVKPAYESENSWQCSCGKANPKYFSNCSCGKTKREVMLSNWKNEEESASNNQCSPQTGEWKCMFCGRMNGEEALYCSQCGVEHIEME